MASGGVHACINTNLENKRKITSTTRQGKAKAEYGYFFLALFLCGPECDFIFENF